MVDFISRAEIFRKMKNAIHEQKQVEKDYCYLTVNQVYLVERSGSLDFGGKELIIAPKKELVPRKKQPEDQYGWWNLDGGSPNSKSVRGGIGNISQRNP